MTLAMAMTLAPAAKTFLAKARENWAKKDWRPALSAAINPHPACQSHFSSIFCSSQSHFFDFIYQSVLDRTIGFWRCQNKYLWHKVKGIRFAAVFDADYCHYWLNRKAWVGREGCGKDLWHTNLLEASKVDRRWCEKWQQHHFGEDGRANTQGASKVKYKNTKVHKLKSTKYYWKWKMKYESDSMIWGVGRPL